MTWQDSRVDRASRWQALSQQGATLWFTGLPAAGKSTIAAAVEARLLEAGQCAYRLDGDNLRHGICADLGFGRGDRERNVQRVGEIARLFADSGTIALVSLVSPYADCRRRVRELHEQDGLLFLEVYVNTCPEECERRDPKGLYARARAGELVGLTGIDAPYEAPRNPDVELVEGMDVDAAAETVLRALGARTRAPA